MHRVPAALLAVSLLLAAHAGFGQESNRSSLVAFASGPPSAAASAISPVPQPMAVRRPFQTALGVKLSSLGVGVESALPLATRFNLRAGTNFFGYGGTFPPAALTTRPICTSFPSKPALTGSRGVAASISAPAL